MPNGESSRISRTSAPTDVAKAPTDHYWAYVCLSVIVAVSYAKAPSCGFVHDDVFAIVKNPDVDPSKSSFVQLWANDFWGTPIKSELSHKSYRPVTTATFRVNAVLTGLHAPSFHAVNVVLHLCVTLLLFNVLNRHILHDSTLSLAASALFASHPIHVEAVTGTVGRAELLASLFALYALHRHAKMIELGTAWRGRCEVIVLCAVAIICKEQAVMTLPVCALYELMFPTNQPKPWSAPALIQSCFSWTTITYAAATILLSLLRFQISGGTLPRFSEEDNPASFATVLQTRILSYLHLHALNAWLLIFPSALCFDWQMGSIPLITDLSDTRNIGALLLYLGLAAMVMKALACLGDRTWRTILFSLGLSVLYFLPASNIITPVGFVLADRVLYLPSIGFCILVTVTLRRLLLKQASSDAAFKAAIAIMVVAYSAKSFVRTLDWTDRESLNRSGLEVNPLCGKCHYNLGNIYKEQGLDAEAAEEYSMALRLWPNHPSSLNNLGLLFEARGDKAAARRRYRQAIESTPGHSSAYVNLGNLAKAEGDLAGAERLYIQAVKLSGPLKGLEAKANLAGLYQAQGNMVKAARAYEEVMQHNPKDPNILLNFAMFQTSQGNFENAKPLLQGLCEAHPRSIEACAAWVTALEQSGATVEAERSWEMLSAESKTAAACLRYGDRFLASQDFARAVIAFQKANLLHPGNTDASYGLAKALIALERRAEALEVLEAAVKLNPSSQRLVNQLGHLHRANQNMAPAIAVFELSLDSDTHAGEMKYKVNNLFNAATLQSNTNPDRAVMLLMAILQDNPQNGPSLAMLAQLLRKTDPEKAEGFARKAVETSPQDAGLKANLAAILHARGKLSEALAVYDEAMALDSNVSNLKQNRERVLRAINTKKNP